MNPFSKRKTITSINCSVTNIQSLSTTVTGATRKKLTQILDLKAKYLFQEHDITNHAFLIFTIDIEKAEKARFFRANPALLNHPNYKP